MAKRIKIARITQTCEACPSQWDMWDTAGNYYYVRYRWGCLSVEAGEGQQARELYRGLHGEHGWGGIMSTEEMKKHTRAIFNYQKAVLKIEAESSNG